MATIKPRRGTGVPSGLAQNELAVDSTNKRVYVGDAGGAGVVVASHITDYVSSLNGATGAITNVAKTDTAQTFTELQQFAGISAAGGTFISSTSGLTPLIAQYNSSNGSPGLIVTTAGQARVASLQLGRSAVTTYNTLIHNTDGLLSFYNGITTGANPLAQFSPSLGQTFSSSNGLMRVQKTQYVGGDSAVIRIVGANSLLNPPTTFNSDIVANSEASANTTHTLPAITGTLLNTASSYVVSVNGSTGAVTDVARINEGNTFSVPQVMNSGITSANLYVSGGATFASAVVSDGGYRITSNAINAQTDSYSLQESDNGKIITVNAGSVKTITVPTGLSVGFNCTVMRIGAGRVAFSASGTTINSVDGLLEIASQHGAASLLCYASNTFNLSGNLG